MHSFFICQKDLRYDEKSNLLTIYIVYYFAYVVYYYIVYYFELKAIKTQQIQGKLSTA